MNLQHMCASIRLHYTLHSVTTDMDHNVDVVKTSRETTQHDTIDMYWLTVVSMSSCCATE